MPARFILKAFHNPVAVLLEDAMGDYVTRILQRFFDWFDGKSSGKGKVEKGGGGEILCDSCKYNYGNVCVRNERPNATRCPDFKRR